MNQLLQRLLRQFSIWTLIVLFGITFNGLSQQGDADGDGLSDSQEAIIKSNPRDADTDGDGINDGDEYFRFFTDPTKADTDEDGLNDAEDPFPTWLNYTDLSQVTTSTDRLLNEPDGSLILNQLVEIAVGNVITIDWFNHLTPTFSLGSAVFRMSFDFIDPNEQDYKGDGFYKVNEDGKTVDVLLPSYHGSLDTSTEWRVETMTISDWHYHLFSKPLEPGQSWDFNVFYHEFLAQGEDPYFSGHAEVIGQETLPIDSKLGRREYDVIVVEATFSHVTFNDPFFSTFLGPNPTLRTRAYFTADTQVILRYTAPFFRITPSKSVGFSDFIVNH